MFACCVSVQEWAVSGELRDFSGGFQESSPHKWVTPAASHRTPLTTRSAQVLHFAPHVCICTFFYICIPSALWCMLPDRASSLWRGEGAWQDISPWDQSRLKRPKKCEGKRKRYGVGKSVLSTALSSSRRLPFICSQLLRMHCSRWAVPPIPTPPWPTCKDWALYCAVLRRFCQQRLLCMRRHRLAFFSETMILANTMLEIQAWNLCICYQSSPLKMFGYLSASAFVSFPFHENQIDSWRALIYN